jgi:uncharacterized protein (DUF1697 family)
MSKIEKTRENTAVSYVAFLRGINNIGSKTVKMNEVKRIFEAAGFKNVKTVLASGNIVFETSISETDSIIIKTERQLEKKLGYKVNVALRTLDELHLLVNSNPFSQIRITPKTKLFLTFLTEKPIIRLKIPYQSPENDFTIMRIAGNEVYSVVNLLPNRRPYRIISFLEKEFGKKITNRNWNTILKIVNT